ncbi:hypothetical protein Tco_0657203 [Tanacetum coccineum]|uniref:Reverse transcriptase domain-containing protein n=1 Tax=Tanacetum coccineum TaxID=301880 RepID=A0ABQ4XAX1_9ASTR
MQSFASRFFKRNVSSYGNNRSSSKCWKGKKKKNGANGVRDNKMSFSIQCHNRKDRNEKPQSGRHLERVKGGREKTEEVFTINHERPNQYVTIGTTLTTDYKRILTNVLRENIERMMEKVLAGQRGQNAEIYLEEILIKSKNEQDLVQDVEETLRKLKRVNIKIDPITSSFRLTTIRKFIPKLAELKYPIHKVRMRFETTEGSCWTNEAEEALQRIKRKLNKLQTMAIPKKREVMMLCLCQRTETISSVLLVKREGIKISVSYMSRPLQGMEICDVQF